MANSVMANLPPINGLYVAFFSVMTYFFLGTCRHLSLGTHGVVSLVIFFTHLLFIKNFNMVQTKKKWSILIKKVNFFRLKW